MWLKIMLNFRDDMNLFCTFQNAIEFPLSPLRAFEETIFEDGQLFDKMLPKAAEGEGKFAWDKIAKEQVYKYQY